MMFYSSIGLIILSTTMPLCASASSSATMRVEIPSYLNPSSTCVSRERLDALVQTVQQQVSKKQADRKSTIPGFAAVRSLLKNTLSKQHSSAYTLCLDDDLTESEAFIAARRCKHLLHEAEAKSPFESTDEQERARAVYGFFKDVWKRELERRITNRCAREQALWCWTVSATHWRDVHTFDLLSSEGNWWNRTARQTYIDNCAKLLKDLYTQEESGNKTASDATRWFLERMIGK